MIVVLSLNTALDRTLLVPGFRTGQVFRAERVVVTAGGKGLNVARTVRQLGSTVRVIGFLGGAPTQFVEQSCAADGIEQRWVRTAEDSRTCIIVMDPESADQTVINEEGPYVSALETEELWKNVLDSTGPDDLVSISGSAPPGVQDGFYGRLVGAVQEGGTRVLVDVSGAAFAGALPYRPWAVAPNMDEASTALGISGSPEEVARSLAQRAEHALLTLGSRGVIHGHDSEMTWYRPPAVASGNAVASGDAFAAGFLVGTERGWPVDRSVRLGIACGASNASRPFPGIGDADEIERLMAGVAAAPV